MPTEPLLTKEECNVDVCVLGTGLTESLAAAALARHGKRVLHLDRGSAYGGNWRALNLSDLESWASSTGCDEPLEEGPAPEDLAGLTAVPVVPNPASSCFSCRKLVWDPYGARSEEEMQALRADVGKRANAWSIDVVPRLLFGRSELVDVLVESGVARYLEFQGLKSARVLTSQGLVSVPLTKSDIFQDPVLTLPEKRMLMRFITSMSPYVGSLAFESPAKLGVDQARKVPGPNDEAASKLEGVDLEQPWSKFLEQQKLSLRLQEFLTYAICLWDWALPGSAPKGGEAEELPAPACPQGLTAREGLRCLGRFISSLGVHGRGTSMPLLYPMYGVAEMAQGFTRMCALHHGTYALRTCITQLLASRDEAAEGEQQGAWHVAGVVTQRGEVIRATSVITSCDHLLQRAPAPEPPAPAPSASAAGEAEAPAANEAPQVAAAAGAEAADGRGLACKRMTAVVDCALLAEEGLNLCVVPPRAVDPPLGNVVQVLQLDWTTGTCPKGYHVVHLSQAVLVSEGSEDGPGLFADLERALLALLTHAGGEAHCVLRCTYLQRPRRPLRWDASTPEGQILESCTSSCSLMVSADPAPVPQLLAGGEVGEAREAFLRAPLYGGEAPGIDDFLRKPAHVAVEEQGSAMEELQHFNEEMLSTEQASADVTQLTASPEADEGGTEAAAGEAAASGAAPAGGAREEVQAAASSISTAAPEPPPQQAAAEGPPAEGTPGATAAAPAAGGAEAGAGGGGAEPPPGGPDAAGGGRVLEPTQLADAAGGVGRA